MMCVAPSEIIIATSPALRLFGLFAEAKISRRYLKDNGRDGKGFFPPALEDFTDKTIRGVVGNIKLFTDYVQANNPHVDVIFFERELRTKGLGAVPDIVTHLRLQPTKELYEIKPNSNSGRSAGREKLVKLDNICKKFSLPYIRGMQYNPDVKIRIWRGLVMGVLATAYLHFMRAENGLIVYEICVEGDFSKFPLKLIIFAIAMIIIFIVTRGRIPAPQPGLPPPTIPIPIPKPVPIPVPASIFSELGVSAPTGPFTLSNTVGPGAANVGSDVRAVQLLLNDWLGKSGGNLLSVDGVAGPKMLATLDQFQKAYIGGSGGIAEPSGDTMQLLIASHLNSLSNGIDHTFMDDMHLYRDLIMREEPNNDAILNSYLTELGKPE